MAAAIKSRPSVNQLSIVIPTYGRDVVLTETIGSLIELPTQPGELIIVDQSPTHNEQTTRQLDQWHRDGQINWMRLDKPSITRSMNHGLRMSRSPLVLFLDDDIRPRCDLIAVHVAAHSADPSLWATVGQVIQPEQQAEDVDAPRKLTGLRTDEDFPFHSTRHMDVQNVMAGNLCVNRERALSIGGFDENFGGAAFRFETEFARRVVRAGGKIRFLGNAGIDHLRAQRGGTRSTGTHLASADPKHGVGDHYFAMLHAKSKSEAFRYSLRRIFREVRTKFHLTHPWWIPVKLLGEIRAYRAASRLISDRSDSTAQSDLTEPESI